MSCAIVVPSGGFCIEITNSNNPKGWLIQKLPVKVSKISWDCLVDLYKHRHPPICTSKCVYSFKNWIPNTIVTRNGKIVWKHRPNWLFYAVMLRTKLYQSPFFFTGHQNVNKPKSRAARTVYGPIFFTFYKIIVSFFYVKMQTKQDQTVR